MDNGAVKASFPLATTEVYKSADGARQERTEWHNIVMWRGLANLAEKYLRKGKQVFIEGKLTSRSFEDQNGIKKYIHEVVAEHIVLMSTERREENREPNSGSGGGNLNEGGMGWSSGDDSGFDELT